MVLFCCCIVDDVYFFYNKSNDDVDLFVLHHSISRSSQHLQQQIPQYRSEQLMPAAKRSATASAVGAYIVASMKSSEIILTFIIISR